MIFVATHPGDEPAFISAVRGTVEGLVRRAPPQEFRVIRLDNWFGPRWRRFSGKILGALGIWKGRLTVPPFHPSRIESEQTWFHTAGGYEANDAVEALHTERTSEENLRHYLVTEAPDAALLWYSGRSAANGKGTIMVYLSQGEGETSTWYVQLDGSKDWKPNLCEGISPEAFLSLRTPQAGQTNAPS